MECLVAVLLVGCCNGPTSMRGDIAELGKKVTADGKRVLNWSHCPKFLWSSYLPEASTKKKNWQKEARV